MEHVVQYTASGEAHGLVNVYTNSVENTEFKHMTPAIKAKVEKEKKEDSQIKKVELLTRNNRHDRLEKVYCKYAGDPIQMWKLIPGRTYDVPYGLVKEVNERKMPKRSGLLEVDGEKVTKDGAPLDKDTDGDWVYKLVPVGF